MNSLFEPKRPAAADAVDAINLIDPRFVLLSVTPRREKGGYRVGHLETPFYIRQGWTILKKGREHVMLQCPAGEAAPFLYRVAVPTQEQIRDVARSRHASKAEWGGYFGDWPAYYFPPRTVESTSVNPFTGEQGAPNRGVETTPYFSVGIRGIWKADVLCRDDGEDYQESECRDAPGPTRSGADDLFRDSGYLEGAVQHVGSKTYERSPQAREDCIRWHGTSCCVCDFNFEEVYGDLAQGFIHVHHIRPLSQIGEDYVVNPQTDLRPVCPNCHAVIHLNGGCLSIDEARALLRQKSNKRSTATPLSNTEVEP